MAGSYTPWYGSIWTDDRDWPKLTRNAQYAYQMLATQPDISWCGVLSYTPGRWAKYSVDGSREDLERDIQELEEHRFVVVDRDTEELLVRTYIKHARVLKQPQMVKAMLRQYRDIHSPVIRHYIYSQVSPEAQAKLEEPQVGTLSEGLGEGLQADYGEGLGEPLAQTLLEKIKTSTSTSSSSSEVKTSTEEEVFKILADRRLAKRIADVGEPANRDGWLRSVVADLAKAHRQLVIDLRKANPEWAAERIADAVEPPPPKPRPSIVPRTDCETCEGSAMVLDENGDAMRCPDCNTAHVA